MTRQMDREKSQLLGPHHYHESSKTNGDSPGFFTCNLVMYLSSGNFPTTVKKAVPQYSWMFASYLISYFMFQFVLTNCTSPKAPLPITFIIRKSSTFMRLSLIFSTGSSSRVKQNITKL